VPILPLTWSDNLAAAAHTWATHLTMLGLTCTPQYCSPPPHDPGLQSVRQGENLWGGTAGASTTAQQVQSWVNEKNNYDGGPIKQWQPGMPVTGHYTQMVWRNTNEVGCATASDRNMDFLVCRYSPWGNFPGQMPY